MAPPDPGDRVALGDGAFEYVGAFIDIINNYSGRQSAARRAVETALGLDKVFAGEEGAALRQAVFSSGQDMNVALSDTTNTIDDLEELGAAADQALRNINNVDEVLAGLFRPETVMQGDPLAYDRAQYAPGTEFDPAGQPVPEELRGPNSIEEELDRADQVGREIEDERLQREQQQGEIPPGF